MSSEVRSVLQLPVSPPSEDPSSSAAGALCSQTLFNLSRKEREEALADVHCVAEETDETPEFVLSCLDQLDEAVSQLPLKPAYLRAKMALSEYVNNRRLRLQFLRAEYFQSERAATRLASFFETKMELFGTNKLTGDILLQDLEEKDFGCLESGCASRPSRDRGGRPIIFLSPCLDEREQTMPMTNKLRALWYTMMAAIEDEGVEKKGIVVIVNNALERAIDRLTLWRSIRLIRCLPVRIAAVHYCHNVPPANASLVGLLVLALDDQCRARFREHRGPIDECIAVLATFGIPGKLLSADPRAEGRIRSHHAWLETRKRQEEREQIASDIHEKKLARVSTTGKYDVLFGRGKAIQEHAGNQRCRDLVETHVEQYEKGNRLEKTLLAETIVRKVKDASGRFLRQVSGGGWQEVNNDTARDKIAHAFRTQRRTMTTPKHEAADEKASVSISSASMRNTQAFADPIQPRPPTFSFLSLKDDADPFATTIKRAKSQ